MSTLGIFVKHPIAGNVKTRLAASIGADAAASFYAACVADLVARFRTAADCRVLSYTPATAEAASYFACIAGQDYELWAQPGGTLGVRLQTFFSSHLHHGPVVAIGSDSPTLPDAFVAEAFDALRTRAIVIGPAVDGGYYLIGMARPVPRCFDEIDWGTASVFRQTLDRCRDAGHSPHVLPTWFDVDTGDDLRALRDELHERRCGGQPPVAPLVEAMLASLSFAD